MMSDGLEGGEMSKLTQLDAALTALGEAQIQLRPLAEDSDIQFAIQYIRRADDVVAQLYAIARNEEEPTG